MKCNEVNAREQNKWIVKRELITKRPRTKKIAKKTERVRGRESETDRERQKEAEIG